MFRLARVTILVGSLGLMTSATAGEPRPLAKLKGHREAVSSLVFTPDGKTLVSGSDEIKLWELSTAKERAMMRTASPVLCLSLTPDGKLLASADERGALQLWDMATAKERVALKGHPGIFSRYAISSLVFTRDGKTLISGGYDGSVKFWDLADATEAKAFSPKKGAITSLALTADGKRLAIAFERQSKGPRTLEAVQSQRSRWGLALWDIQTGKEQATLVGHHGTVHSLVITPDGKTLVSGSADGTIKMWDLERNNEKTSIAVYGGFVSAFLVSAMVMHSDMIATASFDGRVRLWDAGSRKRLALLHAHEGVATAVAFSPDGNRLATGGLDDAVRIWSLPNGQKRTAKTKE